MLTRRLERVSSRHTVRRHRNENRVIHSGESAKRHETRMASPTLDRRAIFASPGDISLHMEVRPAGDFLTRGQINASAQAGPVSSGQSVNAGAGSRPRALQRDHALTAISSDGLTRSRFPGFTITRRSTNSQGATRSALAPGEMRCRIARGT